MKCRNEQKDIVDKKIWLANIVKNAAYYKTGRLIAVSKKKTFR
jgi:hypothetical protein